MTTHQQLLTFKAAMRMRLTCYQICWNKVSFITLSIMLVIIVGEFLNS